MNNRRVRSASASRTTRTATVLALALVASIAPRAGTAAPENVARNVPADSPASWQHRRLDTLLKQLREAARERNDAQLSAVLQRVRIAIPSASLAEQFPNAYAIPTIDAAWVVVEAGFIQQVGAFAELGALVAMRFYGELAEKGYVDTFTRFCDDYERRYTSAVRNKLQPPGYRFRFEDFLPRNDPRNSAHYILADKLAGITWDNTVVWTVLHEVGHHVLGHARRADPAASQRQELQADSWAFSRMRQLGYSIFGVGQYFGARNVTDNCFSRMTPRVDEKTSTHPTWRVREDMLYRDFDVGAAADNEMRIVQFPIVLQSGVTLQTLTFPGPGSNEYNASIVQGGKIALGGTEWSGKTATVFVRENAGGRLEFIVTDATRVTPQVKQRMYDPQNRYLGEIGMDAIQMSPVDLDWIEMPSMRFSDARERLRGNNLVRLLLRKTGASEAAVNMASQAIEEHSSRFRASHMQFLKGRIDVDQFKRALDAEDARHRDRMLAILGPERHRALTQYSTQELNRWMPPANGADTWEKELLDRNFR